MQDEITMHSLACTLRRRGGCIRHCHSSNPVNFDKMAAAYQINFDDSLRHICNSQV